jgi:DNA-binding LytR/AlgR family response regulator
LSKKIKIRLETDPSCHETEVIIRTGQKSEWIESLVRTIERCAEDEHPPVMAYKRGVMTLLDQQQLLRVYTENRRVILYAENGRYESRQSLRELEEALDKRYFVRISRFEIVNLRKAASFDFSNAGTIRVIFEGGTETWVARRYVQAIQQTLRNSAGRSAEHA